MFALRRCPKHGLPGLCRLYTISTALHDAVDRLPHKEALRSVKQDVQWSYTELQSRVDELANGFLDLGFQPKDTLALWLQPHSIENIVTQLAAARAGLTLAVMEPQIARAQDVALILQDSHASGIIFEPIQHGRNQMEVIQGLFPELATFREEMKVFRPKAFRHLHSVITTSWEPVEGMINLSGMMVNSPEPYAMKTVAKTLDEKTPFAVVYSNVEGQNPKKSAVLTHGDVLKRAETLAKSLKLTATDKILLTGEQTGLSLGPFAAISQNAQIVLPSTEFSEDALHEAIEVEHCSVVGSGLDNFKRV